MALCFWLWAFYYFEVRLSQNIRYTEVSQDGNCYQIGGDPEPRNRKRCLMLKRVKMETVNRLEVVVMRRVMGAESFASLIYLLELLIPCGEPSIINIRHTSWCRHGHIAHFGNTWLSLCFIVEKHSNFVIINQWNVQCFNGFAMEGNISRKQW